MDAPGAGGATATYRILLFLLDQVVRYEQGQKYEAHHDFFDVCDLEDKTSSGRRTVRVCYVRL